MAQSIVVENIQQLNSEHVHLIAIDKSTTKKKGREFVPFAPEISLPHLQLKCSSQM